MHLSSPAACNRAGFMALLARRVPKGIYVGAYGVRSCSVQGLRLPEAHPGAQYRDLSAAARQGRAAAE